MSVIELRKQLHQEIEKIEDESILNNLFQITRNVAEGEINNEMVQITEQERRAIEEGRREIKEGNAISFDDFKKKYPKWFTT